MPVRQKNIIVTVNGQKIASKEEVQTLKKYYNIS